MTDQPKLTPVSAVPGLFRSPISTAARATELLEGLGRTADDVAGNLLRARCYGVRAECGACPIATFLLKSDLSPASVLVLEGDVELLFADGVVVHAHTTDAVDAFVTSFDGGRYPQLTAPAVTA